MEDGRESREEKPAGATTRVEGELEKEHLGVTPETGAKREGAWKMEGKVEKKNPQE